MVISLCLIPIKSVNNCQNFNINSLSLSNIMYHGIL